jgi:hypothetical protein
MPARLAQRQRQRQRRVILHLPQHWPWAKQWTAALWRNVFHAANNPPPVSA